MIECAVSFREAGQEPTGDSSLYWHAWGEFIELQVMDREAWVEHHTALLTSLPRYEFTLTDGGTLVGGLILVHDHDVHVGECMSVLANYVLPEYRSRVLGSRLFRAALNLTRDTGCSVLAFTHRVKDWQYITNYRKLS